MKKLTALFGLFLMIFALAACTKEAGEGGTSIIKGKIYVKNYNSSGTSITSEYDGQEVDVYIIYGDESNFYNDRIRTSYDGSFEFPYLEKGNYRVFVYSQCFNTVDDPCPSGMEEIVVPATISKNKSTVDLGTIVIKE